MSTTTINANSLDTIAVKDVPNIATFMPRASKDYGKTLSGQLKELVTLCIRNNDLLIFEYYDFCLFDDARYTAQQKKEFTGINKANTIYQIFHRVNPWSEIIHNKIGSEILLKGLGLTTTKTLAVISPSKPLRIAHNLDSIEELSDFLSSAEYPLFGKPSDSLKSLGAIALNSYDRDKRELIVANGDSLSLDDLLISTSIPFVSGLHHLTGTPPVTAAQTHLCHSQGGYYLDSS